MPTLDWIGKDAVIRHHKEVPFRLLEPDAALSHGDAADGNLIVQGDNLHALKALLPKYAGRVKCIYIDPPYNTGNEGWVYNDNVKAPEITKWLGQVVGKEAEDLSRHDKWLCMMYPRLVLLKQFLRDDGAIFVSIDDNEVASLRLLMDEVFGSSMLVAHFIWEKRTTREILSENERGLTPETIWKAIEVGTTDNGMKELLGILHDADYFDTPKPSLLIQRILQIASDPDSIILDSFAGSGTTGHAVLKQNAEDGGTRKFILVEMEPGIAEGITAERVRRVAAGYTDAKGNAVDGLGGGVQFCRLSAEPLFNEFGDIRDDVTFAQLADFVWFSEAGTGYVGTGESPLLGIHEGRAVYLLFNGILGDRRPQGGNILTQAILDALPAHAGLRRRHPPRPRRLAPRRNHLQTNPVCD